MIYIYICMYIYIIYIYIYVCIIYIYMLYIYILYIYVIYIYIYIILWMKLNGNQCGIYLILFGGNWIARCRGFFTNPIPHGEGSRQSKARSMARHELHVHCWIVARQESGVGFNQWIGAKTRTYQNQGNIDVSSHSWTFNTRGTRNWMKSHRFLLKSL